MIENKIILDEERVIFVVDKMEKVKLIGMVSEFDIWRDEHKPNKEVGEVGYIDTEKGRGRPKRHWKRYLDYSSRIFRLTRTWP